MKKRDWIIFISFSLLTVVILFQQFRQTQANILAAKAIAESERLENIRKSPADAFIHYSAITPTVVQVGKQLEFASTKEIKGIYNVEYTDDLFCEVDGSFKKVKSNKDYAASTPTEGAQTGQPWLYPYTPTEATECQFKTVYCFTVEGIFKCGSFTSERFQIN